MPKNKLRKILSGLSSAILLTALCFGLGRSFGGLRPLGDLIAPSTGIWRHHPTDRHDLKRRLQSSLSEAGLQAVEIEIGDDEIPHLKSESDDALFFAQGFVTSYYRLWQMDFLSRITAGQVAEILGEKALPIDRFFRRMRIPAAARASATMMVSDPVTKGPLAAYTRGVNARIAQIDLSSLPIEYRLFGIFPEPWSDERAAFLLKFMTWELTGYLYDLKMTASKAKLSKEVFELLFPLNVTMPGTILPEMIRADHTSDLQGQSISSHWVNIAKQIPNEVLPDSSNGSNSWAMPARLMTNNRALIANDLHLSYTLPALWFSIQLTSPTMNVYGASLPGAPGVIAGFNDSMGWAVTNGTDDVLDWYSLRYRDERRQEYLFEGTWRPVVSRDEILKVVGQPDEIVKTRETHLGPIVFDDGDKKGVIEIPSGLAAQWTGHTPSNELRSFLMLNRAVTAGDCLLALKGYIAPAQNFVCADRAGRIVYKHAGSFPNRQGRDGRFVVEASGPQNLWQGTLSSEENPTLETSSNLIITANQAPFNGPALSQYGWFFAAPFRALQIRSLLEDKKKWRPEQMIDVQSDTRSMLAKGFKRLVLRESAQIPLKDELKSPACKFGMSEPLVTALEKWTGEHESSSRMAPLLENWFSIVEDSTWKRLIGNRDETHWPTTWRLLHLMEKEPTSAIWDDPATSEIEVLNDRLRESLRATCLSLSDNFDRSILPEWASYQSTTLRHSGRLPGLGRKVRAGGVADSVFANKGQHGPTWKMIVTFEDPPRAWAMTPGGQSGDPSSLNYDVNVDDWSQGKMQSVRFNARKKTK